MGQRLSIRALTALLSFIIAVPSFAQQDAVTPPILLNVAWDDVSMSPMARARLTWTLQGGAHASVFLVMRAPISPASSVPPDANLWNVIDTVVSATQAWDVPPLNEASGFAYRVDGIQPGAEPLRSNMVVLMLLGPGQGFPLTATLEDSGRVRLRWMAVHESLSVALYTIHRAPPSDPAMRVGIFPIDSVAPPVHEYVDRPPALAGGGSFVYLVTARLPDGKLLYSLLAAVYVGPPSPAEWIRLSARVHPPDTVVMEWMVPFNTPVEKFYIVAAYSRKGVLAQTGLEVVDSTQSTSYRFVPPWWVTHVYVAVKGVAADGRTVWSNGVGMELPGRIPDPPRLTAGLSDSTEVSLSFTRSDVLAGLMAYLFRGPVDQAFPSFAYPWSLVDSTTGTAFADRPPAGAGFIYQVRIPWNGIILESNPVTVILRGRIDLQVWPDADGSIHLSWHALSTVPYERFVVWRQWLRDSVLSVDPNGGTPVDTVRGMEWKDRIAEPNVFGAAYRVQAIANGAPAAASPWVAVRLQRPDELRLVLSARTDGRGGVRLVWTEPFPVPPLRYIIERASMPGSDSLVMLLPVFVPVDSVSGAAHEYLDHPPLDVASVFGYRVTAVTASARVRSTVAVVHVATPPLPTDVVRIVSDPVRTGRVGIPYLYQARAATGEDTALVHWSLLAAPTGMTVHPDSGNVEWMPFARGWYRVVLAAVSTAGGKAVQEYGIAVGAAAGAAHGRVTDTLGQPLPYVLVRLFRQDATLPFEYSQTTDSSGTYAFGEVETGSYKAFAMDLGDRYASQWWLGRESPEEADAVVVADSATTTVDFILRSRLARDRLHTVSGMVMDTSMAHIAGAVVTFVRVEEMFNSARGAEGEVPADLRDKLDASLNPLFNDAHAFSPSVLASVANAAGQFSVEVPEGAYVVSVYAPGHLRVYYGDMLDPLMARVLKVHADTSGIAFILPSLPPLPLGSIGGRVTDSSGQIGLRAHIFAFPVALHPVRVMVFAGETDTTGAYRVGELPPGSYVVMALAMGHYAPSFYSVSGPTHRWREATPVSVNGNEAAGLDIRVRALTQLAAGFTRIRGFVLTVSPPDRTLRTLSAGVAGSLVYAATADGSMAGYGLTDANGFYVIGGLSPQSYTVTTDRVGYDAAGSTTATPTYDETGQAVPGMANLQMNSTTTSVDNDEPAVPSALTLLQNFPNPFNPETRIEFRMQGTGWVKLSVFDLLGREVAVLVNEEKAPGSHRVTWDAAGRPSGVYFASLQSGNVAVTKRMVLVK